MLHFSDVFKIESPLFSSTFHSDSFKVRDSLMESLKALIRASESVDRLRKPILRVITICRLAIWFSSSSTIQTILCGLCEKIKQLQPFVLLKRVAHGERLNLGHLSNVLCWIQWLLSQKSWLRSAAFQRGKAKQNQRLWIQQINFIIELIALICPELNRSQANEVKITFWSH